MTLCLILGGSICEFRGSQENFTTVAKSCYVDEPVIMRMCVCVCVCVCVCACVCVLQLNCAYYTVQLSVLVSTGLKKTKNCVSQWRTTTRWKLSTNVHNREHWGTQKNAVEPRVLDQPSSSFVPLFVVGVERRIGKGLLCLWEGWRGELEGASFVCGRGGWGIGRLVSWYFEPSQPQRVTSWLKTMFNLSPIYSARKSSNHKLSINLCMLLSF